MKIGIMGNYGATNIGDDAILTALLNALKAHEVTVFSANPQATHEQFNVGTAPLFPLGVRSFLKYGIRKPLSAIKGTDVVILGGGGLFQDNRLFACLLWAWQVFWVKWLKRPLFIYATGVGPLHTWLGRKLTSWAYSAAMGVTVRDEYSAKLLSDIKIAQPVSRWEQGNMIHQTADPAFLLQKEEAPKDRAKGLYVISLRPWLKYNSKIISVFVNALLKLKEEKGARFVFACMQSIREKDHLVIDPVVRKVGGEIRVPKDFAELLGLLRGAEFAIGMRYHFLMAAMMAQTPVIPVSYGPKVDELFKGTPLEPYLIPVHSLTAGNLERHLKRLSVDYNNVKIFERARTSHLAEAAAKNTELFDDFLNSFDQNLI
ncbi:polysaccharide pyruvyl transferase family protein [Candidatus Peregrinibacteria bacterium]|nr:polysaccharide pyruvyl transferase family protein [Candidatus Peregrinibacteria bacterium]